MRVTVEDGPHTYRGRTFSPFGPPRFHGERNPRVTWESTEPLLSGRLFVGFNVCDRPRWTVDDLAEIVKEVRTRQVGDPGASFVIQKGLYRDRPSKGQRDCGTVYEDGAQVIVLNLTGAEPREFRADVVELAGEVARRLEQREVVVEIQRGGVSQEAMGVAP